MSANTETTGANRTGCKAWCGTYAKHSPTYNRFWDISLRCSGDHAPVHWCSHECREQKLPPIAAPAAHIERRKGQRWKWERNGIAWVCELIRGSGYAWNARGCDGYSGEGFLVEADWTGSAGAIMTLLADAPPEQAMGVPHPKGCRCKQCEQPIQMKSPPAQEAPKAETVCTNGRDCKTPIAHVFERVLRDERQLMCDFCYLDYEFNLSKMMRGESTGKPYAGPERLPKPQLAADWVEDCLPTVWR